METVHLGESCEFLRVNYLKTIRACIPQSFTDIKLKLFIAGLHRALNPEAKCPLTSL